MPELSVKAKEEQVRSLRTRQPHFLFNRHASPLVRDAPDRAGRWGRCPTLRRSLAITLEDISLSKRSTCRHLLEIERPRSRAPGFDVAIDGAG